MEDKKVHSLHVDTLRRIILYQYWGFPLSYDVYIFNCQNYLSDKILGKTDNDGGRSRCRIWSQNGRLIGSIIGKDESNRLLDLVRFSPITDKFSKNWILWYFWLREEMIDEKLTTPKKKFSMGDNKQCSTDNPGRTIWNLNIRYWRIRVISTILGRIHTSMSCLHLFRIF